MRTTKNIKALCDAFYYMQPTKHGEALWVWRELRNRVALTIASPKHRATFMKYSAKETTK